MADSRDHHFERLHLFNQMMAARTAYYANGLSLREKMAGKIGGWI